MTCRNETPGGKYCRDEKYWWEMEINNPWKIDKFQEQRKFVHNNKPPNLEWMSHCFNETSECMIILPPKGTNVQNPNGI